MCGDRGERVGGGMGWEVGVGTHTLKIKSESVHFSAESDGDHHEL